MLHQTGATHSTSAFETDSSPNQTRWTLTQREVVIIVCLLNEVDSIHIRFNVSLTSVASDYRMHHGGVGS